MSTPRLLRLPADTSDRELLFLCVFVVFAFSGWTMSGPLVPLVLVDLGASPSLLGAVVSVSALGSLLVAVPGGLLIGKWGSARVMSISLILGGVTTLFLALFPSIPALFVGLVFIEIWKILLILGAQAHIGSFGGSRDLSLDYGWYGTANAVGQLVGPFSAGLIMDSAGHAVTWVVMSVILALTGFVLPRFVPNRAISTAQRTNNPEEPRKKKGLRHYLNTYAIIAIIASFAVLFADGARTTFFPVMMSDFGYSAAVIGFFLSLRAFASMSVRGFLGNFIKMAGGRFPALIVSIFIMGLGIGITPFCRDYLTLSLGAVLVGIGMGLSLPLSMATVSEGVPPEDRNVAMGIRLTGNRLAQLINPIFFGLIAQSFGYSPAFIAGGVLLFLCALPILFWWRNRAGAIG